MAWKKLWRTSAGCSPPSFSEANGGGTAGMWLAAAARGGAGAGSGTGCREDGEAPGTPPGPGPGDTGTGPGEVVGTLPSDPCRLLALRQLRGCTTTSSTGAGSDLPIRTKPSSTPKKSTLESVRSFSHSRVRRDSRSKRGDTHTMTADSRVEACMINWPSWL